MSSRNKTILLVVLGIIGVLLLLRVVFDQKFDDFDRYVDERENYEGGTAEYDKNLEALGDWFDTYKKEHPGATDADAEAAWKAAWGEQ